MAEATTPAGDDEVPADPETGVLDAIESLLGPDAEADDAAPRKEAATDGADAPHPTRAARLVAGKAEQDGTESEAEGDSGDTSAGSDAPPGVGRLELATEIPTDASAGVATAKVDIARAAEPLPAADAPAPLFDAATRASTAPDVRHVPAAPPPPPEVRFAEVNHPKLITAVRGELLPDGGSMQIRLDPPELGDLLVSVELRAGVVTASFQTSNDDATRLLSHSLADLKVMLEQQGVTVDRLQVRQSPRDESSGDASHNRDQNSGHAATAEDRHSARRDQHRRDLIQKMWDKLAGRDPLDLVA